MGDALASSKRSGKSTGFLPATYTAGGQTTRFPIQIAALHGDVSMDKLKSDAGDPRGSSRLGVYLVPQNMRVAPSRILVSDVSFPFSNPWLEPIY